jgi:NAD(P)-dependent dehydrogenase (short-subunit alcohol dehydrogenase family)
MGLLSDKVALVFGAGNPQNMGAEIARRYAAEGAKVIAAGRKDALVAALAAEIAGEPLCCDITAESEVVRAADWIRQHFGAIDILASAVGVQYHATLSEATECGIDMLVRAHIHAPIFLMKHIAPLIRQDGAIVMISSVTAELNSNPPGVGIYAATKAATNKLLRTAAIEFGARGIRVNAIAPGLVETPMGKLARQKMGDEMSKRLLNRTPLGRLATAADIAGAALFLSGKDCFLTGEVLQVNGGFHLYDAGVVANTLDAA